MPPIYRGSTKYNLGGIRRAYLGNQHVYQRAMEAPAEPTYEQFAAFDAPTGYTKLDITNDPGGLVYGRPHFTTDRSQDIDVVHYLQNTLTGCGIGSNTTVFYKFNIGDLSSVTDDAFHSEVNCGEHTSGRSGYSVGLVFLRKLTDIIYFHQDRMHHYTISDGVTGSTSTIHAYHEITNSSSEIAGLRAEIPDPVVPPKLYMVGFGTDALFTLDPATGVATRVGSVTAFGVNESSPNGLASHVSTLYMIGDSNGGSLFTLDPTTGAATRVGSVTGFGVGESRPRGLASHVGMLYMIGDQTNRLYTLDPVTGVATPVGRFPGWNVGEGAPSCLESHDGTLYMTGTGTDVLYTLDPTTGIAARVGSAYRFGVNESFPRGLASHVGTFYMVGQNNGGSLFTLDPTTSVATRVGNSVNSFGVGEGVPSGLASHSLSSPEPVDPPAPRTGRVLMGGNNTGISQLNLETGVGNILASTATIGEGQPRMLAFDTRNRILFMTGRTTAYLSKLDLTTFRPTRVGNVTRFGVNEDIPNGGCYDSVNDNLLMTGNRTDALYLLDRDTGAGTAIGRLVDFGVNEGSLLACLITN